MKKNYNIAIVGLGQVGLYLYNELRLKNKKIEIKTGKKIKIVANSARNKNKKRKFKFNKKIFYKNPFDVFKKDIDILIECVGQSDGISKSIVEKALIESDLGINPQTEGSLIRLPLPQLTEERRNEYLKLSGKISENSKVAIRNIRRDGIEKIKSLEKNKEIGQDDSKKFQNEIEAITSIHIKSVEDNLKSKEEDLKKI